MPPPLPPNMGNLVQSFLASMRIPDRPREPVRLPPGFTGFDYASLNQVPNVQPIIPMNILYYLFDFIFEGTLPHTGTKSSLPLLREDEVPLIVRQYSQWASAPFSREVDSVQDSVLDALPNFTAEVPCGPSLLLTRLWQGIAPMSHGRWKEKKLDDWENWQFAFEFLWNILRAFQWLTNIDVLRTMVDQFNDTASKLEVFQNALNARRTQMGVEEKLDLKALWLEFIRSVLETMVSRAHNWMHDRVVEITASAQAAYNAAVEERGEAQCYDEAKLFGECHADLTHLLYYADFIMMIPLNGFAGFTASPSDSKVVGSLFPVPFRQEQADEISKQQSWQKTEQVLEDVDAARLNAELMNGLLEENLENRKQICLQLRGERKEIAREHWISILHSRIKWSLDHGGPQNQQWGFVAYQLTHTPNHEQWIAFFSKLYTDLLNSGEGIEGFSEVKDRMSLQWINGRDSRIPHDDIQAARRHFSFFRNSPAIRRRAWKEDFLVIDTECFNSYMNPAPTVLPTTLPKHGTTTRPSYGDFGGFVKLIEVGQSDPAVIAKSAPFYNRQLKVLGSMVFDDLYPLLNSFLRPRDLWVEAMLHPQQVYVGHTVPSQVKGWEMVWKSRKVMNRALAEWAARTPAQ